MSKEQLLLRPAVAGDGILELRDIRRALQVHKSSMCRLMCCLGTSVQASSISATERTHPRHPNARSSTEYRTHVDIP